VKRITCSTLVSTESSTESPATSPLSHQLTATSHVIMQQREHGHVRVVSSERVDADGTVLATTTSGSHRPKRKTTSSLPTAVNDESAQLSDGLRTLLDWLVGAHARRVYEASPLGQVHTTSADVMGSTFDALPPPTSPSKPAALPASTTGQPATGAFLLHSGHVGGAVYIEKREAGCSEALSTKVVGTLCPYGPTERESGTESWRQAWTRRRSSPTRCSRASATP